MMSRKEMEKVIEEDGGSIVWNGQVITDINDLPSEAELVLSNPSNHEFLNETVDKLKAEIERLTAELEKLEAKKKELTTEETKSKDEKEVNVLKKTKATAAQE